MTAVPVDATYPVALAVTWYVPGGRSMRYRPSVSVVAVWPVFTDTVAPGRTTFETASRTSPLTHVAVGAIWTFSVVVAPALTVTVRSSLVKPVAANVRSCDPAGSPLIA